ncbi:unnamed protein product [Agarophyton chilense]
MTEISINNRRVRSWIYGVITLCSLVVFGNVAEICDTFNACPVRLRGIITIGVLGTIFSLIICVALLCDIEPIIKAEIVFAILLFILYSICVGVVSSVRTGAGLGFVSIAGSAIGVGGLGNTISVTFTWIAEVLVCMVLFMVLTSSDGPFPLNNGPKTVRSKMGDVERGLPDVETPEEEYMEKVGDPKTDSGPDSDQSPNGIVDDSEDANSKAGKA